MASDPTEVVSLDDGGGRALVTLLIVIAIATVVIAQFIGAAAQAGGGVDTNYQDDLEPSGGSATLDGSDLTDVDVHQSLNDSAELDGSGAITGSLGDDVADNRTVSTWVRVDNTTDTRQVVSVDSRTTLVYNGSTDDWVCWSYDDSANETHRVAANATSPGAFTHLQCERAAGSLTLRINDTTSATVQTDGSNATTQTLQTAALDGRIDETRVFNGTLTSSEQTALYQNATAPLESAPRQSRIMYDSYGSLDSVPVYIAGGSLDGTAATKAGGLQGQGAVEGTDWSLSGDTLSLLAGGTLEGAPVIFADWLGAGGSLVETIVPGVGGALRLAAIVPLAVIAKLIHNRL